MPFTTDQAPIRNVTPMKTPIVENTLFSFCARIIWSASRSASKKGTLGGLQLVRGVIAAAQLHAADSVRRNVALRSEERRAGQEWRSRWPPAQSNKAER